MKKIFQSLQRPSNGKKFIPFVDGIRFMAILPVVILHANERFLRYVYGEEHLAGANEQISYLISRGAVGVMIFFALSGFVLSLPFAKGNYSFSYRSYLTRRLQRLEPPYIFWMSLFALIFFFKSALPYQEFIGHYLASLTYTHNIIYQSFPVINPVAWSLEVEIQYYLLAPFIAIVYFNQKDEIIRRTIMVLFLIFFITYQHVLGLQFQPFRASILGQLQHFLVGLLAADLYVHSPKWTGKKSLWWDIIGLASIPLMMFTWTDDLEKAYLFSLGLFLFFGSALKGIWIPKALSLRAITVIGGMCYTVYLTHLPLLELYYSLIAKIGISSSYLVGLSISLLGALFIVLFSSIIFYSVIERPFMKRNGYQEVTQKLRRMITNKTITTKA